LGGNRSLARLIISTHPLSGPIRLLPAIRNIAVATSWKECAYERSVGLRFDDALPVATLLSTLSLVLVLGSGAAGLITYPRVAAIAVDIDPPPLSLGLLTYSIFLSLAFWLCGYVIVRQTAIGSAGFSRGPGSYFPRFGSGWRFPRLMLQVATSEWRVA
jgi:hypothetical protein